MFPQRSIRPFWNNDGFTITVTTTVTGRTTSITVVVFKLQGFPFCIVHRGLKLGGGKITSEEQIVCT